MAVGIAFEDPRAPVVAVAFRRRVYGENDIIAQADSAAQIQQVSAVIVGCGGTLAFYRREHSVPHLRQLLYRVRGQEALEILQAFINIAAGHAPGEGQRQQRQHDADSGELALHESGHGDAPDGPIPLARIQMRTDNERQRHQDEAEEIAIQGLIAAGENDSYQQDQAGRQDHPPDAVQPKYMPVGAVGQAPEQDADQEGQYQGVGVDTPADQVHRPFVAARCDGNQRLAKGQILLPGGGDDHCADPV